MSASCELLDHVASESNNDQNVNRGDFHVGRTAFHTPIDRKPDEALMLGCVLGDEECCAIRDSWRLSLPVVVVSSAEFDELVNRNIVIFTGMEEAD